jgi:hypothetical protein
VKYALAFAFAALGCAGAEPVTITPSQPAAPVAEVKLDAPKPAATVKPAEAAPPADEAKKPAQQGILGVLGAGNNGAFGNDPSAAAGNMWGAGVGDTAGVGGLGLRGIGPGGGSTGQGTIGLGNIGTLGGHGFGGLGGRHKAPKVLAGATQVAGRLPPEVIKRIAKQHTGRFRYCYEKALLNNPKLEGKVVVRFVIGRDGAVINAANQGSTMPDAGVVSCVVSAFQALRFPQPEGGVVVVTYPLDMHPADVAPPPPPPPPPPTQTGTKPPGTTAAPKR